METVIIEGTSIEDALTQAMDKLGVPEEDIDYRKLKHSEEGIKIEAFRESDIKNVIKEVCAAFLEKMGATGNIEVMKRENDYYINIVSEGMDGMLIGKSGKTLEALQHILSRIIHKQVMPIKVMIDVAGYKEKKIHNIRIKALAFAEEVKRTKREYEFEPLPPSLRRIIHITLNNKKGIRTYTLGDGVLKKVVIAPSFK